MSLKGCSAEGLEIALQFLCLGALWNAKIHVVTFFNSNITVLLMLFLKICTSSNLDENHGLWCLLLLFSLG